MEVENLRYVVFVIDSKYKDHDGKVFATLDAAREFIMYSLCFDYADKAVIGCFYLDNNSKEMNITQIDSVGFKGDKTNINQTKLF